jgi:hypothetical protein
MDVGGGRALTTRSILLRSADYEFGLEGGQKLNAFDPVNFTSAGQ